MRRRVRAALIACIGLLILELSPLPAAAQTVVVSCPFMGLGGDFTSRGFYVSNYPGTNIDTVTLRYSTRTTGTYTITLAARLGAYDGQLIGASTTAVTLSIQEIPADVVFPFGGVLVPQGSTVTFTQSVSGPGSLFFDVGNGGIGDPTFTGCPGVFETDGTTPPLDTFRRASVGLAITQVPSADVRVTLDGIAGSYLRSDGQTDDTMAACSTGRRMQNEPTVAVDPSDPRVVVAGANDYCAAIVNGEVWTGYYRSTDGGATWSNSLVPGYPDDSSAAGIASPVHGSCAAAGDPTQAFDREGRLFYAFICFNRSGPVNGAVYATRYLDHGASYDRTVLLKKGTPSGLFLSGLFQDKINLTVDQTAGSHSGNVYVAWSQYNGFGFSNSVLFTRSTDHGLSYSRPFRVTPVERGTASFTDLAVGPDGAVYLTYLTYPSSGRRTSDIWLLKSTDGGVSFGPPSHVASITRFDSDQFSGTTGTVDCGDGPFACESGFTYSRFFSSSAVAADSTGVHVVYAAEMPSGQSKIFVRNSPDGVSFSTPAATLDTHPLGHQWFPDIASADGTITVVFYDSRSDTHYSPDRPPGNTADGVNSGDVVQAMIAQSSNGLAWTESTVSTAGSNFGWETHGFRRLGFWGDYLYVSAVPGAVHVAWTDSRDLVPGSDPRETGADDDGDVFDVFQPCTYVPNDIDAPSYSSPTNDDPCLSQGGLDQNIYGARL